MTIGTQIDGWNEIHDITLPETNMAHENLHLSW